MTQKSLYFSFILLTAAGLFASPYSAWAFSAFSDGTLIKGSGPEVYALENGLKRHITTEAVFDGFEYNWDKIQYIADEDLARYPTGKKIDNARSYPEGALVRGDRNREGDGVRVYLVKSGSRRWIETEQDFQNLGLFWGAVMDISAKKLKTIGAGQSLKRETPLARPLAMLTKTPDAIVEGATVKFEFTGIAARTDKKDLTFETFIEARLNDVVGQGIDTGWVSSRGKERILKVPAKAGRYVFFVRAKDPDGVVQREPASYAFDVKLSPYFNKVSVSASVRASTVNAQKVTLTSKTTDAVSIAGWTIGSKKYNTQYIIPSVAQDIPNHPYFSSLESAIVLNAKNKIIVHIGKGPLGVNFRLNRCIGYLNTYYPLAVPSYCPNRNQDEIKNLSAVCQKVISQTPQCREVNAGKTLLDAECIDYARMHLTYSQCVVTNNAYYDFYLDEWWTYLNLTSNVWAPGADSLLVRDQNDLLVAEVSY